MVRDLECALGRTEFRILAALCREAGRRGTCEAYTRQGRCVGDGGAGAGAGVGSGGGGVVVAAPAVWRSRLGLKSSGGVWFSTLDTDDAERGT